MRTISGRKFWTLDPQIEDLNLGDISHSLSQLARFTGHLDEQYSVAQHCVILCGLVPPEYAWWALLHDAAEAYMNDVNQPTKHGLKEYRLIEENILRLVAVRWDLSWPIPEEVLAADRVLTKHEAANFGMRVDDWQGKYRDLQPLGIVIQALPWRDARALFREVLERHDIRD